MSGINSLILSRDHYVKVFSDCAFIAVPVYYFPLLIKDQLNKILAFRWNASEKLDPRFSLFVFGIYPTPLSRYYTG